VGETLESQVTLHNRSILPKLGLEVRDLTDLPGHVTGVVVNMRPLGVFHWRPRTPIVKRGLYTLGPVRVVSRDPLGLFRLERAFAGTHQLIVYPAVHELPSFRIISAELTGEEAVRRRVAHVTPDVSSIREYVEGDSFNRIHWPSTVRFSHLMVKEFDSGQGNHIWILLDMQEDAQAGKDEVVNTEEYAVTVAASIARRYLTLGWPVGLVTHGDRRYLLELERGANRMEQFFQTLAAVRARGRLPLAEVLRRESSLWSSLSTLIAISPSLDLRWPQALEGLSSRRVRTVAILVDPTSFGAPGDTSAVLTGLSGTGALTYVVRQGVDLSASLDFRALATPMVAVAAGRP
jgi:uncharacterized protein (DUF58 family)